MTELHVGNLIFRDEFGGGVSVLTQRGAAFELIDIWSRSQLEVFIMRLVEEKMPGNFDEATMQ